MKHTLTATALTAALLVSTAAYAGDMKVTSDATIKALPEKGAISLSGTVDRVVDGDTFILRDSAGDTIDVHTAANVNVQKGDAVSVKGDKTAELAGIGKEINNATLTVTDKIQGLVSADGESTTVVGNTASLDTNTKARVAMKNNENTESPAKASDNTESKKTAAYDLDVDADVDVDNQKVADAKASGKMNKTADNSDTKKTAAYDLDADVDVDANVEKVADAGEMTAKEATATATGMTSSVMANADAQANDIIDNLPKTGSVELSGVVTEVEGDNSFTLRDADGKTIDVKTASNVEVQKGDSVSVNGNMKSKLLGLGREIESAKVLVVSAAN